MRALSRRIGKLEAAIRPADQEGMFRDPGTGELVSVRDLADFLTMAELSIAEICLAPEKADSRDFYNDEVCRRIIDLEPEGRERIMTTLWHRSLDRRAQRREASPLYARMENDGFEWLLNPELVVV